VIFSYLILDIFEKRLPGFFEKKNPKKIFLGQYEQFWIFGVENFQGPFL
jgi:hypothetical protein